MADIVAPGAPYITPAILTSAATGISWNSIPSPSASPEQKLAEQLNICMRATSDIDGYCNVPLRATIDTETLFGPGNSRFQIQRNGVGWLLLSRPPVVSVLSGQWSPAASFPPSWTQLAADQFKIKQPIMGVYGTTAPGASGEGGQEILVAPGVIGMPQRDGIQIEVTYLNGWPHAQITTAANVGDTTVHVDDITGWAGAIGTIHDPAGQEAAAVKSVSPDTTGALSGPGTLTLSAPLTYAHAVGTLYTTLPATVIEAAILFSVAQALVRGGTSVTAPPVPGSSSSGGGKSAESFAAEAELKLVRFRRTV